ncbi:molybdopterin-binding protein [Pedobacter jejuensis]|uniref:Molybdopterin-binding protein n=1 Tax=Pedobacter jejuensis TaxID=1268550 RepID=A0A3N0C148_9SPHI|nr:molybdopterin-binding protein [Pedobacter jejuensis]RNL55927.1 molybdopterin-binding protein [Pedobacter jejuensis]
MKYLTIIILLFASKSYAQESKQFTIDGKIKNTLSLDLGALKDFKSVKLDSMVVFNHLMQRKSVIQNINGVLLKDVLSKVEILSESPKKLSEYYIVCTATDGYKVVFSWNEIFNTDLGKHIFVLTSFDVNPSKIEKGNIASISPTDYATGRRFVKGLNKISILQVN